MDKNICVLVKCLVVAVIAIIIEKKVEKERIFMSINKELKKPETSDFKNTSEKEAIDWFETSKEANYSELSLNNLY